MPGGAGLLVGYPRVDRPHPVGIGPEGLDHLGGDVGRRRVHEGPVTQRPADQVRVTQGRRVAELGIAQHGQVVHGDHPGSARRVGGTTKLVPCTTSLGPTNHSTGGRSARRHAQCKGRAGIAR